MCRVKVGSVCRVKGGSVCHVKGGSVCRVKVGSVCRVKGKAGTAGHAQAKTPNTIPTHFQQPIAITTRIQETNRFYGTGFVEFGDVTAAARALALNGQMLLERPIKVGGYSVLQTD